ASFGKSEVVQLSTSQGIGLASALLCAFYYAKLWEEARKNPAGAMSKATLGEGALKDAKAADGDDGETDNDPDKLPKLEDEGEVEPGDETRAEAPVSKALGNKKKGLKKKTKPKADDEKTDDEKAESKDESKDEKAESKDEKAESKDEKAESKDEKADDEKTESKDEKAD
ncbi:MAG: hypothetical protein JNM74_08315, partial [Myxococcales bacterium]|nr:hypothetical protein [Myxococcales bacterium]